MYDINQLRDAEDVLNDLSEAFDIFKMSQLNDAIDKIDEIIMGEDDQNECDHWHELLQDNGLINDQQMLELIKQQISDCVFTDAKELYQTFFQCYKSKCNWHYYDTDEADVYSDIKGIIRDDNVEEARIHLIDALTSFIDEDTYLQDDLTQAEAQDKEEH